MAKWLQGLGLGKYVREFRENGFDSLRSVERITEEDMAAMDVLRGHRRMMQGSIEARRDAVVICDSSDDDDEEEKEKEKEKVKEEEEVTEEEEEVKEEVGESEAQVQAQAQAQAQSQQQIRIVSRAQLNALDQANLEKWKAMARAQSEATPEIRLPRLESPSSIDVSSTSRSVSSTAQRVRAPSMQIFVKTHTGATLTLQVDPSDTIADVKLMVNERIGVPSEKLRFLFCGKQLNGTLFECNITPNATLHQWLPVVGDIGVFNTHEATPGIRFLRPSPISISTNSDSFSESSTAASAQELQAVVEQVRRKQASERGVFDLKVGRLPAYKGAFCSFPTPQLLSRSQRSALVALLDRVHTRLLHHGDDSAEKEEEECCAVDEASSVFDLKLTLSQEQLCGIVGEGRVQSTTRLFAV